MAGFRIPGPLCVTTCEPIDDGTMCLSKTPKLGPIGTEGASFITLSTMLYRYADGAKEEKMHKISREGVGNLTVEVYDGNSVVKVHNAIVKISGHHKTPGHFKKAASFSGSTGLHGFVKFTDIPLDMYKVETSRKWYEPKNITDVYVKITGEDPVGNFAKPNNLAKIKYSTVSRYQMPKYIVDHIPKTTPHNRRPGTVMTPEYLTIHSTGNSTSLANGERNWLTNKTNQVTASYHLVVDEKNVIECLPFNEMAWHAGDGANGTGNRKSIGLEICESGNRIKTMENAITLTAKVLKDRGWNESKLKQHYDWPNSKGYRKQCPRILISPVHRKDLRQTWEWFKSEVKVQLKLIG